MNENLKMKQSYPVFLINLERSTDRLEFMKEQLNEYGTRYEVFRAIDGAALTEKEITEYINTYSNQINSINLKMLELEKKKKEFNLNKEQIGICASHIQIWKHIVSNDIEYSLILEDDVILHPDFFHLIERIVNLGNPYISYVNFHTDGNKIPLFKPIFKTWQLAFLKFPFNRASAYLIKKEMAERFLRMIVKPFSQPIDGFIESYFLIENVFNKNFAHFPLSIFPDIVTLGNMGSVIMNIKSPNQYLGKEEFQPLEEYKHNSLIILRSGKKLISHIKKQVLYKFISPFGRKLWGWTVKIFPPSIKNIIKRLLR